MKGEGAKVRIGGEVWGGVKGDSMQGKSGGRGGGEVLDIVNSGYG